MTAHRHDFKLVDSLLGRYRCSSCPVLGRFRGSKKVPIVCGYELERGKRCGGEAVYADGRRLHARCASHLEEKTKAA